MIHQNLGSLLNNLIGAKQLINLGIQHGVFCSCGNKQNQFLFFNIALIIYFCWELVKLWKLYCCSSMVLITFLEFSSGILVVGAIDLLINCSFNHMCIHNLILFSDFYEKMTWLSIDNGRRKKTARTR